MNYSIVRNKTIIGLKWSEFLEEQLRLAMLEIRL